MARSSIFEFLSCVTWLILAMGYAFLLSYPIDNIFRYLIFQPLAAFGILFCFSFFWHRRKLVNEIASDRDFDGLLNSNKRLATIWRGITAFMWLLGFLFFAFLMYGISERHSLEHVSGLGIVLGLFAASSLAYHIRHKHLQSLPISDS